MRYYHEEHESAYRQIERFGLTQWNDLFDDGTTWTYDHFQNRPFLERVIPRLELPEASAIRVFEYGCGAGPAACFLAAQGFQVDAIDLIPEAIAIARRMASERGVQVNFSVADICDLATEPLIRPYDLVVDSFCLQSIVTDQDRAAVYAAVRARLKPSGYYLISSAVYDPERGYDPGAYDESTGICYREVPAGSVSDHAVEINGSCYIPHRRHLTPEALRKELVSAGFRVISLDTSGCADVVCRLG